MLQIYLTKLCNWAKGIATWTPGLNGPYNPNLTVPQLCLCKMGIMPPCHCTMTVEMTVEINLPTFVKSLSPKLWVSFLPWSGEESELFQTVLVASQSSCPGRNAFLYVLFFMPAPRWRWLWGSLEPGHPFLCSLALLLSRSYLQRQPWKIKAHFHDSLWSFMSDHTSLFKKHHHRPKPGHWPPEMVTLKLWPDNVHLVFWTLCCL